jgi:serine/threonine protein kinase
MAFKVETNAEPIPGYRLLERLGGGGFGEVWKAEAPGGLLKAIKFVYGDIDECGEEGMRAEQELKAISRVKTIRHPFILSLERYEVVNGQLLIVTELADRNLWDRFKECRVQGHAGIPRDELLDYMEEAAEALDLMNTEYQLQHLDIKPQNLFLVYNHIKIADFGLVKDLEGMVAKVTGGVTPVYAAPETFDGWVSRFSDQYSLAIVYQELLTGQRPFPGTNVRQLIVQHMYGKPDLSPLPASDRAAIGRALAKKPEDRFPSCRDLIAALLEAGKGELPPADVADSPDRKTLPPLDETSTTNETSATPVSRRQVAHENDSAAQQDEHVATHVLTGNRGILTPQPADAGAQGGVPSPVHGDGVLFPALVVGLGELGMKVLLSAREKAASRFGSVGVLGNVRFLGIDTNAQVLRSGGQGSTGLSLANNEIVIARLNRPSYYLKNRDGRNNLDGWFDAQMLYRIPRSMETAGVRALGRLAFCDNHATITRALRQELEECLKPDNLARAVRDTQLGLRGNRPRVYIACSLMGGTGSGMFLDAAYLVRRLLREMGYESPEVIGLFLLPGCDRSSSRPLVLGNTHAALRELDHFSTPGTVFKVCYGERDTPTMDPGAPFVRSFLLQLHEPGKEQANQETLDAAGDFLMRELTHPLGRVADLSRAELPSALAPEPGAVCHSFGLVRYAFPRHQLLQDAAQRICRQMLERWVVKDSTPLRDIVAQWANEYWTADQLGADGIVQRLFAGCETLLQQAPEKILTAITEPVLESIKGFQLALPAQGNQKVSTADPPTLDLEPVEEMLRHLDGLLGKPVEERLVLEPPPVPAALSRIAEDAVAEIGQKLAEAIIALIERPDYRLAGAEEAVRQFIVLIEKALEHHEPLCKELTGRSLQGRDHLQGLLEVLRRQMEGGRKTLHLLQGTSKDLADLVRLYPRWRYQSLALTELSGIYVSLRGNLSDLLKDIHGCRARLLEVRSRFPEPSLLQEQHGEDGKAMIQRALQSLQRGSGSHAVLTAESAASQPVPTHRDLFPYGCHDAETAVRKFLQDVTAEDIRNIDDRIQAAIARQFNSLVEVCLAPANVIDKMQAVMQAEAERALNEKLAGIDVAELFFQQYPEDASSGAQLSLSFENARPTLCDRRSGGTTSFSVLGVPRGGAGDRVRQLCIRLLGRDSVVTVPSDDVSIYREQSFLKLDDLEQLGPLAQEAYRQMQGTEHFTPHTRLDIQEWGKTPSAGMAAAVASTR